MTHADGIMARAIADTALPLPERPQDLDPLLDLIGDAGCVLIGEASHGTHEFYRLRAELTRRLIAERGFAGVAAEADWPEAYRVNRWVHGLGRDPDPVTALSDFRRFPAWMWRNRDVLEFVAWLREHNHSRPPEARAGFYGLDLYSLHASADAVLDYLARVDPDGARRARERYACFDHFGIDPQTYGQLAGLGLSQDCEREVVRQLIDLMAGREQLLRKDGIAAHDDYFHAEQNARVVKNAEQYYRTMFRGRVSSWNVRDTHMADTFDALRAHLGQRFSRAKLVVWAHNSHVGDARATEMGTAGEVNIGQLIRQRHPGDTALIGFSTYTGTVTAASNWGEPAERRTVRRGLPDSCEALFHDTGLRGFMLPLRDLGEAAGGLREQRLQRAIGVIYRPDTERHSHYYHVALPRQFDAIIHIDETRALEPLERTALWDRGEAPETFPSGL